MEEKRDEQKTNGHVRWTPEAHEAYIEINRLRDQLAIAQMKNAIVSDVLHAANLYDHHSPKAGHPALSAALQIWRDAGEPGLVGR